MRQGTLADMTEAELLALVRKEPAEHGRQALEELLCREYAWVLRMCVAEIRDRELAFDCVQEALVQIAKALPGFDGRSELRTWLFTIVRRTAIRFRVRDRKRNEQFPLGTADDAANSLEKVETPYGRNSESLLLESEEQQRLMALVRTLPDKQRHAVIFHYFEDLSVEDTAKRLACSEGTVKTHLFRGRERLKELLTRDTDEK